MATFKKSRHGSPPVAAPDARQRGPPRPPVSAVRLSSKLSASALRRLSAGLCGRPTRRQPRMPLTARVCRAPAQRACSVRSSPLRRPDAAARTRLQPRTPLTARARHATAQRAFSVRSSSPLRRPVRPPGTSAAPDAARRPCLSGARTTGTRRPVAPRAAGRRIRRALARQPHIVRTVSRLVPLAAHARRALARQPHIVRTVSSLMPLAAVPVVRPRGEPSGSACSPRPAAARLARPSSAVSSRHAGRLVAAPTGQSPGRSSARQPASTAHFARPRPAGERPHARRRRSSGVATPSRRARNLRGHRRNLAARYR
jgi:hypothetical protein